MKKAMLTAAVLFSAAYTAGVFAADGELNFTGEITETACQVDSKSIQVPLGKVAASALTGKGSTVSRTVFDLVVSQCPASIKGASIKFDGNSAIPGDYSALALNQAEDSAKGVGIQLMDVKDRVLKLHQASSEYQLASDVANTLPFSARYIALEDKVTAGKADAVANFTINYN